MSALCSTAPWPRECLTELARILERPERGQMLSWMQNHMEEGLDGWTSFAIAVAAIGAEYLATSAARAAAAVGGDLIFAPAGDASLSQPERDAEQLTAMVLNRDWAGVTGLMAAMDERDGIQECCGALMAAATTMLQLEAIMRGGS